MSAAANAFCVNHPGVEATGACEDCKQAICTRCTKGTLDGFMCPPCAHKRYGRRNLMTAVKVGGFALLLVGVLVFFIFVVGKSNQKSTAAPPIDAGMDDLIVEQLRQERDASPCDQALVRKLVKKQNELQRYEGAVDDANAYLAKCDDFPRLRWDLLHALQELQRWPEAIKQSTVLLERDPTDSDFWWWRGEDRGHARQPLLALADYRQSMANSERAAGSKFAVSRILDVVEDAGRPCEGVAALAFFVDVHGGELGARLQSRSQELARVHDCAGKRGTGSVNLPNLNSGPARVDVVVEGGGKGRFQVDEQCGTTALTKAFAARVGVTAQAGVPGPVDTVAMGAIRPGAPATARLGVGEASAPAVDVVLVDELPAELDGVLCLSFLWRFDLERRDDGGLTLVGD